MPASIDDLQATLKAIEKLLEQTAKASVGAPGAATKLGAPSSIADHFKAAFEKAKLGGMGKIPGVEAIGSSAGRGASMFGAAGAVGGPILMFGMEMAKLPGKIRAFADELHNANRQFAQFSPSMAMVMAQSDMRDMFRKMDQGEALAGSAGRLATARGNLEDQMAPVDTAFQKLQNNLGAALSDGMAQALEKSGFAKSLAEWIEDIADTVQIISDWLGLAKERQEMDTWENEMDRLIKSESDKRAERAQPVRQPPPKDPRPNFAWDRKPAGGGGDF